MTTIYILTGDQENAKEAAETLKRYLIPAVRSGVICISDDYDICAGETAFLVRKQRLESADVVIPIVCADSLADDSFCNAVKCGKPMISILVSSCMWKWNPDLREKPIISGSNMNTAAMMLVDALTSSP